MSNYSDSRPEVGCQVRERQERLEDGLSPYASRSKHSRGRERLETPCPLRTAFQRDRDRIIHTKAFRRLKHKTQVFIAPTGDHYVTRLTHTLEVAQIARTISRATDLDLGSSPNRKINDAKSSCLKVLTISAAVKDCWGS